MRCEMMKEILLTDYIDGRLEGKALREVEEHISSCPGCRALAEEARSISASLRAFQKEAPAPGVWRAVEREVTSSPSKAPFADSLSERLRMLMPRPRPAFIVATATAVVIFALMAVRFVPVATEASLEAEQYDIFSPSSVSAIGEEGGFGTASEDIFL